MDKKNIIEKNINDGQFEYHFFPFLWKNLDSYKGQKNFNIALDTKKRIWIKFDQNKIKSYFSISTKINNRILNIKNMKYLLDVCESMEKIEGRELHLIETIKNFKEKGINEFDNDFIEDLIYIYNRGRKVSPDFSDLYWGNKDSFIFKEKNGIYINEYEPQLDLWNIYDFIFHTIHFYNLNSKQKNLRNTLKYFKKIMNETFDSIIQYEWKNKSIPESPYSFLVRNKNKNAARNAFQVEVEKTKSLIKKSEHLKYHIYLLETKKDMPITNELFWTSFISHNFLEEELLHGIQIDEKRIILLINDYCKNNYDLNMIFKFMLSSIFVDPNTNFYSCRNNETINDLIDIWNIYWKDMFREHDKEFYKYNDKKNNIMELFNFNVKEINNIN